MVVAVATLALATQAFAENLYANDEVAVPDVINMIQMKAGAEGVKLATTLSEQPAGGDGDILVNGKLYIKNALHTAGNVLVDKEIMATGSIKSDNTIDAKVGFRTAGTIHAKDAITSLSMINSKGITVDGDGTIKGALNVALELNIDGKMHAKGGILASQIIKSTENIYTDKNLVAKGSLQSSEGMSTTGSIHSDQRIVATGDIHSDKLVTAKEGFVTPGLVSAGSVKTTNVNADGAVSGAALHAKEGISSDGPINGQADIKAEKLIVGVEGVRSNLDIIADNDLVAKKETRTRTLTVTNGAKLLETLDVVGAATFGTATIKGQLYVGDRAIGDIVTSMETDMAKMRSEMSETRDSMRRALEMMTQQQS